MNALFVCLIVVFVGLWARLVCLQVFHHDKYAGLAQQQNTVRVPIPAQRGKIYDRRGEILAMSIPGRSIFANPREIIDYRAASDALAGALSLDGETLYAGLLAHNDKFFAWIKRMATPEEEAAVRALGLKGVYIREEPMRFYPSGRLAAQLVGFAGLDQHGLAGAEFAFDSRLSGADGWCEETRDGRARGIRQPGRTFVPAVNGQSIVLTIDTNIQDFLEMAVDRCFEQYAPKSVTGIVMDPASGDILALAERPTFDPNKYAEAPKDTWRLRSVTDTFEPGSMFKPYVFSGAFEQRIVRLSEIIFCGNGVFHVGERTLHDAHPYGNLSAEDVVVKSSNIGMARIGLRLGAPMTYAYLAAFGFGRPTGLPFPSEASGYLVPARKWSDYTLTSVPMGHEVSVTAVQIAAAFSAIANGGHLLKPRILRGAIGPDGKVVEKNVGPEVVRRVITPETSRVMTTEVLRKVVTDGTGRLADIDEYEIAGKTGTAQKLEGGLYSHSKYVSSFVCTGPVDSPRAVVLIVVDEPSRGASLFGGTVAAPQAADVLRSTLDYMYIDSRRREKPARMATATVAPVRAARTREVRNAP